MRADLVEDALQMAVAARNPDPLLELVHHSDRGSQYTSDQFTVALAEHDILASMSSVGDAYDNSMAESLVDTFKTELIADRVWRTRAQLEVAIARWVGWYNELCRRRHKWFYADVVVMPTWGRGSAHWRGDRVKGSA
jgi:putative transposase